MPELIALPQAFSVCKLNTAAAPDTREMSALRGALCFIAKTADELSLVCETRHAPPDAAGAEHGWRALRVAGTLDFGMVGVIAGLSATLAAQKIPIFVVSTFDTDYILIKEADHPRALAALAAAGHTIGGNP